jgi:hypothetical protein
MKNQLSAVVFACLAPCLAYGQPPKPVQKLGYYVGTWRGQGETKGGPFGPAGKLSSTMTCGWFSGGFQVICRGEETGPTGKRGFLNILAYDQDAKAYTEYSVSSFGESEYDRGGSLVDGRLTFVLDGGTGAKVRYTEVHLSPVLYTYRVEASARGGPWTLVAEGKIAKVK